MRVNDAVMHTHISTYVHPHTCTHAEEVHASGTGEQGLAGGWDSMHSLIKELAGSGPAPQSV